MNGRTRDRSITPARLASPLPHGWRPVLAALPDADEPVGGVEQRVERTERGVRPVSDGERHVEQEVWEHAVMAHPVHVEVVLAYAQPRALQRSVSGGQGIAPIDQRAYPVFPPTWLQAGEAPPEAGPRRFREPVHVGPDRDRVETDLRYRVAEGGGPVGGSLDPIGPLRRQPGMRSEAEIAADLLQQQEILPAPHGLRGASTPEGL